MLKEKSTYEIISPETIGLKQSTLVLGKHSGRHAFREKLIDLGYEREEEFINIAFAKFKDLADRKKNVTDEDILALLEEKLIETPEVYSLSKIDVRFGYHSKASAYVTIIVAGNDTKVAEGEGNGSVDAMTMRLII